MTSQSDSVAHFLQRRCLHCCQGCLRSIDDSLLQACVNLGPFEYRRARRQRLERLDPGRVRWYADLYAVQIGRLRIAVVGDDVTLSEVELPGQHVDSGFVRQLIVPLGYKIGVQERVDVLNSVKEEWASHDVQFCISAEFSSVARVDLSNLRCSGQGLLLHIAVLPQLTVRE